MVTGGVGVILCIMALRTQVKSSIFVELRQLVTAGAEESAGTTSVVGNIVVASVAIACPALSSKAKAAPVISDLRKCFILFIILIIL